VSQHAKTPSAGSTTGQGTSPSSFARGVFAIRDGAGGANGSGARSGGGVQPRALVTLCLVAAGLLALLASPALAAQTHPYTGTSFGPDGVGGSASFERVQSLAVDPDNGDTYVYDGGAGKVYKFNSAGAPVNFSATGTNAISGVGGSAGGAEYQIALAPAGSPAGTVGDIYVANNSSGPGVLQIYAPSGTKLGELDQGGETCGVATDPSGNFYAGVYSKTINKYTPTANPPIDTDKGPVGTVEQGICNVAADGLGNVYAANYSGSGLYKLEGIGDATPTKVDPSANTMAIAPGSNDLYADRGNEIVQYDPSGNPIGSFGNGDISESHGIAINSGASKTYVGIRGKVKVFGPLTTVPTVTTGVATQITPSSATLNGTVDPKGVAVEECFFEYDEDASESYGSTAPCAETTVEIGTGTAVSVHADITGLGGLTRYHFRLVIKDQFGTGRGGGSSFETAGPPRISEQTVAYVDSTGAEISAFIRPGGEATAYRLEYVSEAAFGKSGYATAIKYPIPDQAIGSGTEQIKILQSLTGLVPLTTYHVRVVAANVLGSTFGPDETFTTFGLAGTGLPDGRVYEQASPTDKNGTNIQSAGNAVQAARDGNRITFFASSGIPGGVGSQDFPLFLAGRQPGGWSVQGLLPPQATGPRGSVRGWSEELSQVFSSNFETSTFQSVGATIYANDIKTGELVTAATGVKSLRPFIAATSADGSIVAWEEGAPRKVMIWDRGSRQSYSAGILNDGTIPAGGVAAGPYNWFATSSGDAGSAGGYYTQYEHALSEDGSRLYFSGLETGQLYLRTHPMAAQSPLNPGGECVTPTLACTVEVSASQATMPDPGGEHPPAFIGATPDGRFSFFMSQSELTDDANTGPADDGRDLYRYDAASSTLSDITPDSADPNGAEVMATIGFSEDASRAYFVANADLAAGASPGSCSFAEGTVQGTCNLYEWHNGLVTFIAQLEPNGNTFYEPGDSVNWKAGANGQEVEASGRVSPSGDVLLFASRARLTAYDNRGVAELYRFDATTDELHCVSCSPTGIRPVGDANVSSFAAISYTSPNTKQSLLTRNLSVDGSRVFFDSRDRLVPQDTNGVNDVYEWEAEGSGSCSEGGKNGGCLYLISGGTSPNPSYFGDAGVNGDDVFFFTAQPLVAQDKDELVDVYDARVNGGIASQNPPPPPAPCIGNSCRSAAPSTPASQSPGSASFSGPPNPVSKQKPHNKKRHKRKHHSRGKGKHKQAHRQEGPNR
jgi:hypothetical protein